MTMTNPLLIRGIALVAVLLAASAPTAAQQTALKRLAPDPTPACAAQALPAAVSPEQRARAVALASAADRADMLGENGSALGSLRNAANLDPSSAAIAYRLARAYEEADSLADARVQYCRYLQLAPNAADAAEVTARVAELPAPPSSRTATQAADFFRTGVEHFDAGRLADAERAFTAALRARPNWAAAHFNRAAVRIARNDREDALGDLERYLALEPGAADRELVGRTMRGLRGVTDAQPPTVASRAPTASTDAARPPPAANRAPAAAPAPPAVSASRSASGTLVRGLVLPGWGQLHTRRPVLGLAVMGGVVTGAVLALRETEVTRTVRAVGPFGTPYEYQTSATQRPNLGTGLALGAAVTVLGALEAYHFVRRGDPRPAARTARVTGADPVVSITPVVSPSRQGTAVGMELRMGAR